MNFLHYQIHAGPNNIIQVKLDSIANVMLLDTLNYQKYKMRKKYDYIGGETEKSPVEFRPHIDDIWHVIVDFKGHAGTVNASVKVLNL